MDSNNRATYYHLLTSAWWTQVLMNRTKESLWSSYSIWLCSFLDNSTLPEFLRQSVKGKLFTHDCADNSWELVIYFYPSPWLQSHVPCTCMTRETWQSRPVWDQSSLGRTDFKPTWHLWCMVPAQLFLLIVQVSVSSGLSCFSMVLLLTKLSVDNDHERGKLSWKFSHPGLGMFSVIDSEWEIILCE